MARMIFAHTRYATSTREPGALQEYIATLKVELERFASSTSYDRTDATRRRNLAMKLLDDVQQLNDRARQPWWQRMFATRRAWRTGLVNIPE